MSASVCARSGGLGPLTLRYDRPAEFFEEALVIGNGNLGATLYG
ncbi:MAG: glycoside hydrolase family 95 protein, partial [Duncaniella sp.]|nr:glycoside hydrolase family 95 protein [Duncaniella sp.]